MRKAILFLMLMLVFNFNVYAGGGNGSGGGTGGGTGDGGGVSVPVIVSSEPAEGAVDVPVAAEITLNFENNIANSSVREANLTCFKLLDASGAEVAIEVQIADDQIEPDLKRTAVIKPSSPLEAGMMYTVVVSPDLTSKNGVSIGTEATLTFTTAMGSAEATANDSNADSSSADATTTADTHESNALLYGGLVVIAGIAGYIAYKRKQ